MKKFFSRKKGFTLLELLIVMAVIVILVAAIIAATNSSREKSHKASALQTMRSILPYATDCYMRSQAIPINPSAGSPVCSGANANFPAFDTKIGWGYTSGTSSTYKAWDITDNTKTITCNPEISKCF
ncbi:MAG TPA: type II secretion system protein [Candidatus Moranbacteria bacterium]|nr:type II secretion system protein [Candidatus Moranbacteria bacterium]HRZ34106.1 type II secretion system protein [Candidatus Moranbacteria bacterium]